MLNRMNHQIKSYDSLGTERGMYLLWQLIKKLSHPSYVWYPLTCAVDHIHEQINVQNYLVRGMSCKSSRYNRVSKASIACKSVINQTWDKLFEYVRKQKTWTAENKNLTTNPKCPLMFHHSLNLSAMTSQAIV